MNARALRDERWNRPIPGLAQTLGVSMECLGLYERSMARRILGPELRELPVSGPAVRARRAWLQEDDAAARELFGASPSDAGFADLWRAQADAEEAPARAALSRVRAAAAVPSALKWAGWLSLRGGDDERAVRELEAAARHGAGDPAIFLLLGWARERRGQALKAARAYGRASALDPRTPGLHLLHGRALLEAGRERAAFAVFDEAADRSHDLMDSFLMAVAPPRRGDRFEVHRLDRGLSAKLDERIVRDPRAWWAWALRGALSADFGDRIARRRRAQDDLRRARVLRPRAWILAQSARRALTDAPEVAGYLDRAVALRPDIGWLRAWRGELGARAGRADADADFDAAARLSPEYPFTFAWRAARRLRRGDAAGASSDVQRALELHPRLAAAWHMRGLLCVQAGRLSEAVAALAKSVEFDPAIRRSTIPRSESGILLDIDPGPVVRGLKRLANRPDGALASLWLGELLLALSRPAPAIDSLARATKSGLPPVLAGWALVWRSEALNALGRGAQAAAALRKAFLSNPELQYSVSWRASR